MQGSHAKQPAGKLLARFQLHYIFDHILSFSLLSEFARSWKAPEAWKTMFPFDVNDIFFLSEVRNDGPVVSMARIF